MNICMKLVVWVSLMSLMATLVTNRDTDTSVIVVEQTSDQKDGSVDEEVDEDVEERPAFIASHEWQPILEGQVIPAGLHVRVNLETGVKEAKILDNKSPDSQTNIEITDNHKKLIANQKTANSGVNAIRNQIKEVLKNMKSDEKLSESENSGHLLKNFRSIDEIKRDLDEMDVKIRSESEVLKALIARYREASTEEKLNLLADVEYLVHSIDIGQDLVRMNGIDLLLPDLNSTDDGLRAQVAFTMGSAMNGNPKVQIHVFNRKALKEFLLLLVNDRSLTVKKRALFAISCLVRQFPSAQSSLIQEYGALSIFSQLFKQSDIHSIKLSAKVLTLLNDLLIERQMALKYATNDKLSQIKVKQYEDIGLHEAIVSQRFCDLVPHLLECPDNDVREKTMEAMDSLHIICKEEFRNSLPLLQRISQDLKSLLKSETQNDLNDHYFAHLYQMTLNLINKLDFNLRDEL